MRFCPKLALIAATMVATAASAGAQVISVGWLAGPAFAREPGTGFRQLQAFTAGALLSAELNPHVAFGMELDYVRKGGKVGNVKARLDFMEAPVSLRLRSPLRWVSQRHFARFAVAPSVLLFCENNYRPPNTPETTRVDWDETSSQLRYESERACDARRQNIDLGLQAGIGSTFRAGRVERAVELRVTSGTNNLAALYRSQAIRSKVVAIVFSTATRDR